MRKIIDCDWSISYSLRLITLIVDIALLESGRLEQNKNIELLTDFCIRLLRKIQYSVSEFSCGPDQSADFIFYWRDYTAG